MGFGLKQGQLISGDPVAGSIIINFQVSNMPAYSVVYPYINKQPITEYTKPDGGYFGAQIVTDSLGMAIGQIVIPSDTTLNFPTGVLEIQFGDSAISFESSKIYATTTFLVSEDIQLVTLQANDRLLRSADASITDTNANLADWQTKKSYTEPLAQIFYIDPQVYPNGVFATSVDLYFYSKDNSKTVSVELRNVVGGAPSISSVYSESYVVKTPTNVNIPTTPTSGLDLNKNTNFAFKKPIFLLPGQEYAICVITESSGYSLYSGTFGESIYNSTNNVLSNQNVRRLFKTADYQNPDLDTDVCFKLNIAKFATGEVTFNIISNSTTVTDYFNKFRFIPTVKNFTGISDVSYAIFTKKDGSFPVTPTSVSPNYTVVLDTNRTANVAGDVKVQTTFTNQNAYVSPILDLQGTNLVVFNDNPLSSSSATTTPTESTYITKVYKVEDGKEFTGLSVEVNVNKPADTSIYVYCKLLGLGDEDIEDNDWISLPRKKDPTLVNTTDLTTYVKDIYQKLTSLSYTSGTVTYNKFKEFKIRIDFVSTNSALTPSINKMIVRTV